jgi:hypothetical protein
VIRPGSERARRSPRPGALRPNFSSTSLTPVVTVAQGVDTGVWTKLSAAPSKFVHHRQIHSDPGLWCQSNTPSPQRSGLGADKGPSRPPDLGFAANASGTKPERWRQVKAQAAQVDRKVLEFRTPIFERSAGPQSGARNQAISSSAGDRGRPAGRRREAGSRLSRVSWANGLPRKMILTVCDWLRLFDHRSGFSITTSRATFDSPAEIQYASRC